MPYRDSRELLRDVSAFFFAYFGIFQPFPPRTPTDRYAYYYNYRNSRLSIVIFLPITLDTSSSPQITGQKISIILKETKGKVLVEMEDVRLTRGWQDRLRKRINALKTLVETEVRRCDVCNVVMLPITLARKDPPYTRFVSLKCPVCRKLTWTVFGKGLKTDLHTHLKK